MQTSDQGTRFPSSEEFAHAFRALTPGRSLVYHVGYLAVDRAGEDVDPYLSHLTLTGIISDTAMQLEQEGRAELVQKRLGYRSYRYIIVKRRVVDEEARCCWETFGSRSRQRDQRAAPIRRLSSYHFDARQSFLRRNPHLSVVDAAARDARLDAYRQ